MPQHEALWPALTAYENLAFAGMLFAGTSNHATAEMNRHIDQKLRELGLETCRDVLVGSPFLKGLSGGQKRRLSLGW